MIGFVRGLAVVVAGIASLHCVASDYDDAAVAYRAGDFGRAIAVARPLAAAGNADAQLMVALLYWRGQGVERDDRTAFEWMSKAAAAKQSEALNHLGRMYEIGEGVDKDERQAFKSFESAAESGSAGGQFNVARAYQHGIGTRRDLIRARYWYEQADAAAVQEQGIVKRAMMGDGKDASRRLPDGCRPARPPMAAMNRLGLREVSGQIAFVVDAEGKVRGVRNQSLSAPELRYEAVAWFSDSLRSAGCAIDEAFRERVVMIPYRFHLSRW